MAEETKVLDDNYIETQYSAPLNVSSTHNNVSVIVEKKKLVSEDASNTCHNNTEAEDPPLMQYAQKCAWCGRYLYANDEIEIYNGNLRCYTGWMCHKQCNIDKY